MTGCRLRGVALLVSALVFMTGAVSASVVSSPAELMAALKAAHGGDVIQVAPGTYTGVVLGNVKFDKPVTITSQNPQQKAVFVGLGVGNCAGLVLSQVELTSQGATDAYFAFRVAGCQHLLFDRIEVHGDVNGEPGKQLMGFYFSRTTDVTISHSTFHHINVPILANNDDGVTITGNRFSFINKGGIEMGGSSNVTIAGNVFTDFAITPGTHPDVIQLYTANTKASAHDITIKDNIYYRGKGNAAQGIFIKDEIGTLPYVNLTISNNAMIGGMWNSLYVLNASGNVVITNNVVATWPGLDLPGNGTKDAALTPPKITPFKAMIFLRTDDSNTKLEFSGNRAQNYMDQYGHAMGVPDGNDRLGEVDDEGKALMQEWLAAHPGAPL